MAILINDNTARVQYTATSGQTTFAVPFEFFENSDLKVYRNSTLQTITTHYTLTGAGVTGGGNLTFVSGVTLNDVITIVRDIPIKRVTDFPLSGPFNITALNLQLDQLTAMIQEVNTLVTTRVLLLSEFDQPSAFSAIPTLANRANRYFVFDANGNPATTPSPLVLEDFISLGLGTVSAPTYTFTGDLNTGMWSPGADTLAFSEGGVEAMRITSAGNVGIGTTGPTSRLTVTGGNAEIRDGNYLTLRPSGNAWDMRLQATGTQLDVLSGGSLGSPIMSLVNGGNVGIGTTSPEAVLDVNGSLVTRGDTSGFVYFAPKLGTTPFGTNYDRFEIRVDPTTQVTLLGNVNGGTGSTRALAFLAGTNERMRIDTAGNVGIGTSSPGERLTVTQSQNAGTRVAISNQDAGSSATSALRLAASGGFWDILAGSAAANSNALTFGISSTELMRITNAGNVGIGTSSPSTKLHVAGALTLDTALSVANGGTGLNSTPVNGALDIGNGTGFTRSTLTAGSGVSIANGAGTITISATGSGGGTVTSVSGTGSANGLSLSGTVTSTGNITLSGSVTSVATTATIDGVTIGYRSIPRSTTTTTAVVADVGKCIAVTAGITIPNSTFAAGDAISIYNDSGSAITITAGVTTLRLGGTTTTGNRTLAARGLATVWFNSATEAIISGAGVS